MLGWGIFGSAPEILGNIFQTRRKKVRHGSTTPIVVHSEKSGRKATNKLWNPRLSCVLLYLPA